MRRVAIIVVSCLAALMLVRAVAPAVQHGYLKWGTLYAERAAARRELERRLSQVSVARIVANPAGALVAATACNDELLRVRAEKVWLAYAKRSQRHPGQELAAKITAATTHAGAIDPRLRIVLTKDCAKTIKLAARTVAEHER